MNSRLREEVVSFDQRHYVPCLRWKQGEYQAVLRLKPGTRKWITPLIEVPEMGWDFETNTVAKTVDQCVLPFAKRVARKWGLAPCFVDLNLLPPAERMNDGTHPAEYVFSELRERGCIAIPVSGCERGPGYQSVIRDVAQQDRRGICIRLGIRQAAAGNVQSAVDTLLGQLKVGPPDADMIVDLDAPANFVPLDGFVKLLQTVVERLPHRAGWRTFTLMGTSFPDTMGKLHSGAQLVARYEWNAYKMLAAELARTKRRQPTFGDYSIAHPEVLEIDMRKAKPSASIRYTVDDAWYVLKGRSVRDNGFQQYQQLCAAVVSSRHFAGRGMSQGDAYIEDCQKGNASTGNLTTWRWVGTNHHIEKVVRDIASLYGS